LKETMAGVEQVLPGDVRLNAMYIRRRGSHLLRSVNVNPPDASGVRPDPSPGPGAARQSIARSSPDMIRVPLNYARPPQRISAPASYTLSSAIDETDSPFGLPGDNDHLAAERGPAVTDARHRVMSLVNVPLVRRFRLATAFRFQSALPYNVTT